MLCTAAPCTASLGMETRLIEDAQITASSEWSSNHAAIQARLNFKAGGGKKGAWSAGTTDANQWIQVALGSFTKLTGIATQGRNEVDQWVTEYQLQYSVDGVSLDYYNSPGQSSAKVKPYPSARQFPNVARICGDRSTSNELSFFSYEKVHWGFCASYCFALGV